MSFYIDVIIPIPLQRLFTYAITEAEADFLKPGIRVAVPFGKSKIYTALVYNIHQTPPQAYTAKSVHQILDEDPIVSEVQLNLWKWISNYYMCTLGEVMRAALPSSLILESETLIVGVETELDEENLKDDEFLIYEALQHQSSLKVKDAATIVDRKNVLPVLKRLIDKNVITLEEEIHEKYTPKLVRYVKLNERFNSEDELEQLLLSLKRAPKQSVVLLSLFKLMTNDITHIKVNALQKESQVSPAVIKSLIDKGILDEFYLKEDRISNNSADQDEIKTLNNDQEEALSQIKSLYDEKDVVLLHGVTSSGKTEIYTKLIQEVIESGKQVLYLVPEIALTTQLVDRLKSYFGDYISVYHSRYSLNERVELWNNLLKNAQKAQVILGARSSIFLPFSNLGLVIVDEEHEQSYKQFDPAPRYHARDTAIVLANQFKAKVLLGSATPSLESYYNTKQDKYGLVELTRRFNNVLMPDIELVDLKDKQRRKLMKGHFSDRLLEEMEEALEKNNQVILFQNRRGYAPIVECLTCGTSPQCPNCDVSLTYHQYRNQLRCHYCGYNMAMLQNCMACGNPTLDSKGFGTEQIELEVKELFPDYKVARMDLDTTRGKHGYKKIISAFEQQEIDVLVGTQMLTKGLDFRNVKLVGIMNADTMLNYPDFRAHERSFQLMTQVSGRAGRTEARGKVLIQTYNPYHKILQQTASNDYSAMYLEQLDERHNYKYPPIYRLIKITLKHKDYNKVNQGAEWLSKSLRQYFGVHVLGPEFPPVSRIRNQYHKNILLKIPQNQSLKKTKEAVLKVKNSFLSIADFKSVKVVLNVDNY
ncbi:primosomal protein N' [Winogradskyella sp. 3972H.M.0a.05]|uniref:replication restart helicase PriA n=1 Tax=Winogradskyella sp. 3972H.M.0a.05 TaxID=2950277 RepID=UPI00339691DF